MNILVTGGAGFIGSALCKKLITEGHSVTVLDNFNKYYDVSLKRKREEVFLTGGEVIEGDIRDVALLRRIFSEKKFDVVCHLAAMAGVRYSAEHPQEYIDVNLTGTVTLLEAMKESECKRIVFASSSSVYGNSAIAPFKETEAADAPESVYGATKRAAELLLHSYYKQYGIEATCLRFFTVYGPWSRPDMAMLKFAQKISQDEPIEVYNNGDLERDFTHVDDIVAGFFAAVEKPLGYTVLNLGGGAPVSLHQYIALLESALEKTAIKHFLPMQPGDVFSTYADTTKALELLNYSTKVPIEEGIASFVAWFKRYSKEAVS